MAQTRFKMRIAGVVEVLRLFLWKTWFKIIESPIV
jgi:hypothetical protein